ncbi:hypothetical protein PYW07_015296 [Mythimna separata]|uniref:H15 domain-containing protein n=1 Tax=Mythimna separata TaxID=271217 RepID=A0AAD7YZS2_MYTSE|nr:hypothetical protein PYW07_015296 [Mythimna separata]
MAPKNSRQHGAFTPGKEPWVSFFFKSLKRRPCLLVKMAKGTPNPNVNTGEMVLTAIKKLMKNTGWTARTIIKFIRMEFQVSDPKISRKVSRALKRGVRLGLLQLEQGRYRLNEMSRLARSVTLRQQRQRRLQRVLRVRSRTPSPSSRLENFRLRARF